MFKNQHPDPLEGFAIGILWFFIQDGDVHEKRA